MNEIDEKLPESHECKRQLREQRRAGLTSETKEQHEWKLQLRREARKRRAQSRWTEQTSQEAQRRLKVQWYWDTSRRQCQKAEHTVRRLLVKAKVMLVAMKMKQQQFGNQRQKYLHNQQLRIQRRCEQRRATASLGDFLRWPSAYFLACISARTNLFHSTFFKLMEIVDCNSDFCVYYFFEACRHYAIVSMLSKLVSK